MGRLAGLFLAVAAVAAPLSVAEARDEYAVLIVRADDMPMPTEALERRLKRSLYWGGMWHTGDEFSSLSANVVQALAEGAGVRKVCAADSTLCVTVIRK